MDEPVHTTPQPFATPLGPTPSGFGATPTEKPPVTATAPTGTQTVKTKVEDTPPTKEDHMEAIRYLIAELLKESNEHTAAYRTVHLILPHLDAIEDKKTEKTVKW